MKRLLLIVLTIAMAVLLIAAMPASAASASRNLNVNVLLNTTVSEKIIKELSSKGTVLDTIPALNAVIMKIKSANLPAIKALPYVDAVSEDAVRNGAPVDMVEAENFAAGLNTWNLDAINVTDIGAGRTIAYDGTGVYIAVLDTGLLDSWRKYFPEERIATDYAASFGGGGGERGFISTQPNKWEHDQNSHGTHVTSTILGYSLNGTSINGVAPMATIIPVKVLNQNGSGWSSVIARGIMYVADLKMGPLADYPVVINMSLGGPVLDILEQQAIDYAIAAGVIIVASAGNNGDKGMGYPGAYEPVISVAAAGWSGEFTAASWWRTLDVDDPTTADDFYITDFSSLAKTGQDLDVAAPGSWVVGPYQNNSGSRTSFYYLGGTSMASPHVAGIAALMLQKDSSLGALDVEEILESTALDLLSTGHDDSSGHGLVLADGALNAVMP